ncbi:D-glycero-beta-D-manno-heptose 1-phosphate adenylyltransferase [bacterium]|nr:D-glycero-beta-D-manno-heptose 1-phosphate adenylyltransferase [bacterium]MCP5462427.1 D-glycero-beta-D-manno-heptose 1-phosphate adenylyltransferase [bacterium]
MKNKIHTLTSLLPLVTAHKAKNKKVVFTNGCFDLLHIGHVIYLQECKKHGDILIIGLNTDDSMRAIKGQSRPLVPLEDRAGILAALECVDYVIPFSQSTPKELIDTLKPDVLIKGGDYKLGDIVGKDEVIMRGGKVLTIPLVEGKSTSNLIKTIIGKCT